LPDSLPSSEPALFVSLEKREELQSLATALSQLDEEKREVLRLRYTAGLSFAEIALLLGKNEPAVKMMAYRAIDFLRQAWEAKNG
jgi:RNA polymerase sigma factor (sigma-70 family)